jgi:hypothetical protein
LVALWQGGTRRRVALDQVPGDGLLEGTVEDRMGVSERCRRANTHHHLASVGMADGDLAWRGKLGIRTGDVLLGERLER